MSGANLTVKENENLDRKTSCTHSNLDLTETPMQPKPNKKTIKFTKKLSPRSGLNKQISLSQNQVVYKCGCTSQNTRTKTNRLLSKNDSVFIPLKNERFHPKKGEIKQSISVPLLKQQKHSADKKQKVFVRKMLKRMHNLQKQYEELMKDKTDRSNKFNEIKYLPKQIIKSVDKIKILQRVVQHKTKKIKRIPKQIIRYNQIEVQKPTVNQQLVFIDDEKHRVKNKQQRIQKKNTIEIVTSNYKNQSMRTILNEIRGKITSLDYKIASSNNDIDGLSIDISSIKRAKSLQTIMTLEQPLILLNSHKNTIQNSRTTILLDQSPSCDIDLDRSKNFRIDMSPILTVRSRMLINGKETNDLDNSMFRSKVIQPVTRSQKVLNSSTFIGQSSKVVKKVTQRKTQTDSQIDSSDEVSVVHYKINEYPEEFESRQNK